MYNKANKLKAVEEQKAIEQKWYGLLLKMPTEENTRRAYEELHAFYLKSRGYLYSPALGVSKKVILRVVGRGKAIVELGSGSGVLACSLAAKGNWIVGVDISSKAVQAGMMRAAECGVADHVQFCQGSAIDIPFDDESFDMAVSHSVIEHLHPKEAGKHLHEVRRVLVPNGAYVFYTPNKYDGATSYGMHLKEWGFAEMKRFVEEHGYTCYWLDTHSSRFGITVPIAPAMLWLPELMERIFVRLGCMSILRPLLRPSVSFCARKIDR